MVSVLVKGQRTDGARSMRAPSRAPVAWSAVLAARSTPIRPARAATFSRSPRDDCPSLRTQSSPRPGCRAYLPLHSGHNWHRPSPACCGVTTRRPSAAGSPVFLSSLHCCRAGRWPCPGCTTPEPLLPTEERTRRGVVGVVGRYRRATVTGAGRSSSLSSSSPRSVTLVGRLWPFQQRDPCRLERAANAEHCATGRRASKGVVAGRMPGVYLLPRPGRAAYGFVARETGEDEDGRCYAARAGLHQFHVHRCPVGMWREAGQADRRCVLSTFTMVLSAETLTISNLNGSPPSGFHDFTMRP